MLEQQKAGPGHGDFYYHVALAKIWFMDIKLSRLQAIFGRRRWEKKIRQALLCAPSNNL